MERMIDINIKGVLYGIAAALPHFRAQNSGHFINISSVAGAEGIQPGRHRLQRHQVCRARHLGRLAP
jgi:NADP-dependent 3-hydroxy acid dehydrogenase YdfG